MSAIEKLEQRLSALEVEVAKLRNANGTAAAESRPWWEEIYGRFEGDPHYKEAMEFTRKYRESFRRKAKKKGKETSK
jgi:hypothetical protein